MPRSEGFSINALKDIDIKGLENGTSCVELARTTSSPHNTARHLKPKT